MSDKTATSHNIPHAHAEFPTLAKAPITEALVDIRVELSPDFQLADLDPFVVATRGRFTDVKKRFSWQARIDFNADEFQVEPQKGKTPDGLMLSAPAENLVAQARLDGFTVSKLKPYDRWATLRPVAQELWDLYRAIAKPLKATRIAIRTINRIELPIPIGELKEYILTVPDVAPGVPQALETFFMRLVIPSAAGTAIVTETIDQAAQHPESIPLIFDIDVFRKVDLDPSDPQIWAGLDELRAYKNTIFFRSLTEKTLELFK
jgi:uncharacterized protein (TIGR04255 family)